jgi:hypothetical protein
MQYERGIAMQYEDGTFVAKAPTLVRWGPVFAGAISAVALFALLSALFVALAYGNLGGTDGTDINIQGIADNLAWWLAASAMVAMLLGGIITGWSAGVRGSGVGALNGFITWGVSLFGALAFGTPSILGTIGVRGTNDLAGFDQFWAGFWALLVGLVLAVVGGAIGGAVGRPGAMYAPEGGQFSQRHELDLTNGVQRVSREPATSGEVLRRQP